MPYALKKVGTGFVVVTKATGKQHSKTVLPEARAKAQLRALFANMKPGEK